MKLMWQYLCDSCDAAGIWSVDLPLASFKIGESISEEEFKEAFGEKIVWLEKRKVFIPSFIEFQYGTLKEDSRPHLSVINTLRKHGLDPWTLTLSSKSDTLSEYTPKGIGTLKDKDKDKDKDKEKEQDKEKAKDKDSEKLSEEINQVTETWKGTLRHFGMGRTLLPIEQVQIARAIQAYGAKAVSLALLGARSEPRSESFNPANFLSLTRIFEHKNFQRFLNLGTEAFHKKEAKQATRTFDQLMSEAKEHLA